MIESKPRDRGWSFVVGDHCLPLLMRLLDDFDSKVGVLDHSPECVLKGHF